MSAETGAERRIDGWGFAGHSYPAPAPFLAWLARRLGVSEPLPAWNAQRFRPPPARPLPALPGELSREPLDRLSHAMPAAAA